MMKSKAVHNRILGSLPSPELQGLGSDLFLMDLHAGETLFEAGKRIEFIYFPEQAVVSFLGETSSDGTVEIWSVGHEGLAGMSGILATHSPFRAVVQIGGRASGIKRSALLEHFNRSSVL